MLSSKENLTRTNREIANEQLLNNIKKVESKVNKNLYCIEKTKKNVKKCEKVERIYGRGPEPFYTRHIVNDMYNLGVIGPRVKYQTKNNRIGDLDARIEQQENELEALKESF